MAGARGDALEWALALAEAPGERHALRQRPLPDGVDQLLQLAGGNDGPAMADAVERSGRLSDELVEAARFYAREVMFFPEADAYRVLGLSADASDEQIKHHHRLLQQWLHPDRPASDWDAAFAARVNAAWSQLRTADRREAYAASMPVAPEPDPVAAPVWVPAARVVPDHFEVPEEDAASRWRRRAPVFALFGLCAILGVAAVRDTLREPEENFNEVAFEDSDGAGEAVALQLPVASQAASDSTGTSAGTAAVKPVAAKANAAARQEPSSNPLKRAIAALTAPAKPEAPPTAPVRETPVETSARTAAVAVQAPPAATNPAPALAAKPATVPAAPAVEVVPAKAVATVAASVPEPSRPVVKPQAPVAQPIAAAPAPVAPKPAPVAATQPPPPPPVNTASARQAAQAEQTGRRLLAYVAGGRGGVPPIWANLSAQTQASQARQALQGAGRVSVGSPEWRIGDDTASMRASLSPRNGTARNVRVSLVWREQQWLVSKLELGS